MILPAYQERGAPPQRNINEQGIEGNDHVLLIDTAFSAGSMRDPVSSAGEKHSAIFGPSPSAFGHPGAGGSHAFACVMNQMEPGVLPDPKALRIVEAIYE